MRPSQASSRAPCWPEEPRQKMRDREPFRKCSRSCNRIIYKGAAARLDGWQPTTAHLGGLAHPHVLREGRELLVAVREGAHRDERPAGMKLEPRAQPTARCSNEEKASGSLRF